MSFTFAYHPQSYGQIEVINRSLRNLLRCLGKDQGSTWDSILPQAEFSYNDYANSNTSHSPFELVYGSHPRGVLELRDVKYLDRRSAQVEDFAEVIRDIHQQVKDRLEETLDKCKHTTDRKRRDLQFKVGDMVIIHLKKERLPKEKYTKLMMKKIGPSKIIQKCSRNAYKIDLPLDIGLSKNFNVLDIYPYKGLVTDLCDAGQYDSNREEMLQVLPKKPKLEV